MSDDSAPRCPLCFNIGAVAGRYCTCAMGAALRTAPRVRIGDLVLVFPPGTSMEEAEAVLELAKEKHDGALS